MANTGKRRKRTIQEPVREPSREPVRKAPDKAPAPKRRELVPA